MTNTTDEQGRLEPPVDGDEWSTLTGFLDFHRATLAWKCEGLDAEQLSQTLPPSSTSFVGLMKHLAYVEDDWFSGQLLGEPMREPWASVDWKSTPDWDWESARDDDPREVRTLWEESVSRSRAAAESVYRAHGLDVPARRGWSDGRTPNLRWILTHMVEEYARHNGHADLLRESIDGHVGE